MKTTAENRESFNEILFTGRNKDYGAYELRKKYEKYLLIAFCITSSLFMIGISVPLIASYYGNHFKKNIGETIGVVYGPIQPPPPETPPPPPPPDDKLLDKQNRLLKPIITIDTTNTTELPDQGTLNDKRGYEPVATITFSTDTTARKVLIEEPVKKEPWILVEEMPYYIGGEEERIRFLNDNIEYPATARELGISGTVYVEFIVEETGKISGIKVIKGIGGGCDEEASRVVKLLKYEPGRQAGKAVSVRFTMPIKFMLKD